MFWLFGVHWPKRERDREKKLVLVRSCKVNSVTKLVINSFLASDCKANI
jgi:hypothetical protein